MSATTALLSHSSATSSLGNQHQRCKLNISSPVLRDAAQSCLSGHVSQFIQNLLECKVSLNYLRYLHRCQHQPADQPHFEGAPSRASIILAKEILDLNLERYKRRCMQGAVSAMSHGLTPRGVPGGTNPKAMRCRTTFCPANAAVTSRTTHAFSISYEQP